MPTVRQDLVSPQTGGAEDLSDLQDHLLEHAKEEEPITMNKLWLLLLLVIPYQSIHAEEVKHAPTMSISQVAYTRTGKGLTLNPPLPPSDVEQCRADQRLWLSKLEQPNDAGINNVSFNDLNAWTFEMDDCRSVDPEFAREYYATEAEAESAAISRVEHFLDRHNLYGQLLAEDAQGKGR